MADELNKNAEFSGKHKDEEDPILTAQRYLNIYHQIHIFNERRQKEFDDSLLKMPSDIRVLLSTLPGGSMLLDHITELEEKRGISLLSESEKESIKESKNKNSRIKKKEEENSKNGKELDGPASVLRMLKHSEEKHEKDMKALTDAFIQSQTNMANILKDVLQNKSTDSKSDENKKSKTDSNKSEKWLKDEIIETNEEIEEPEVKSQEEIAKAQTEALAKAAAEALLKAEAQQQQNAEASKLFSLTKRIFSSIKERRNMREGLTEDGQEDKIFNAGTPASLDEIDDDPVSLDKNETTPVASKTNQKQKNIPSKNEKEEKEENTDDDWEWEYVDDDSSDDDSEWEYIEVPEDEPQTEPQNIEQSQPEPEPEPTSDLQPAQTQNIPEQMYPQDFDNQAPYAAQNPYAGPYENNQNFYYPQGNYAPYDVNQGFYDPNMPNQAYQGYDQAYANGFYDPNGVETYAMPYDVDQMSNVQPGASTFENIQANNPDTVSTSLKTQSDSQPEGIESSASLLARFMNTDTPEESLSQDDDISNIIASVETSQEVSESEKKEKADQKTNDKKE